MTGGERRVEPLGDEHALARQAAHQLVHEVDAVVHRLREQLARARDAEVARERADRLLDLGEVARIERHGLDVDAGRRA